MQTPVKILLIEDNPADARLVREWLQEAGAEQFQLEQAERLDAGLVLLTEEGFDMVLLDLGLPDSQGLGALQAVRAKAPATPIVVLSGLGNETVAIQAVREGAQDYLVKGEVKEAHLVRSLRYARERSRAEEALRRKNEELAANIAEREAFVELLQLVNLRNNAHELIKRILWFLKTWSGCDAVGVRLREGADFTYFETNGFPGHFVQMENRLCARDAEGNLLRDCAGQPVLDCMCGNILQGRFDPQKPFFTANGSFWTNSTTELLASTTEADRQARTRNRCNGEGYESVALIPLRSCGETFGLMQMNDRHKGRFSPELLALLERLASVVGLILWQRQAEEALRRTNEELSAANEELAATEEELRSQLEEILAGRKALEESERKYRNLVENALVGVYQTTLAGEVLYANEALVRMLEFGSREALMAAGAWARYKDPQSRKDFLEALKRDGRITNFETEILTQKGGTRCVLVSAAVEGNTLSGMVRDITERKSLEEQVLQSQKMEAIGSLAGGVAHDFNNILMAIMSYSELLVMKLDDGPLRGYAEGIQQSVEKAASLTQRLLAFSRKEVSDPYVLELNEVVSDAEKIFRRLIGEDIELVIRLAPDAGRVKADPGQLEQVIMNLAVNARDAMPQGGKLFIQTANAVLDESDARLHPKAAPGRYVQLSVSDTGRGMDAATQARIFEPFFTTKEKGKGTGLGLSTVYGIVRQSGGFIELESAPGKGARFKVYIPRVEEEAGPTQKSAVHSEMPRGSETVLLVEDEPEILALVNEVLIGQGYTVLQAGTGDAALRLAERQTGPIHLLLTDVVMPGMSGRVLAERLASLRPDVRVIYTSGYTNDAILRHGLRTEGLNFIQKPFRPEALLHKVREVLKAPPSSLALTAKAKP